MARPANNTEKLFIWIPAEVKRWLEEQVAKEGVSTSEYVRGMILEVMRQRRK